MELDEVETRFYSPESFDNLSQAFQQIALNHPEQFSRQLCQRAFNELGGFIVSTLQRCRDLQRHTASLTREARRQEFLEHVQNLWFQALGVQRLLSATPPRQILAPENQVSPWHSQQSQDSGIALFTESDIDMNVPRKPVHDISNLGKAAFSPVRDMTPLSEQHHKLGKINSSTHAVTSSWPYGFSRTQAGPSSDSIRPVITSKVSSTSPCFCQGMCSWCHMTKGELSEAHVTHSSKCYTPRLKAFGTEVNAHSIHEAHVSEEPSSWRACRISYEHQQKYLDQQAHHMLSEDGVVTPSTQNSTPYHSDSNLHFRSAKDDHQVAEEDSEVQYEQLVENITNLVVKSNFVGHFEDDCVPIIQYTHAYLENIQNHDDKSGSTRRPSIRLTALCADGDDPGPDMEVQDTPAVANTNRKRKQGVDSGNRRKRGDDDDEYPNRDDPEDFDDPDDWSGDKKRARLDDCQKFPCPYRKRHPTRFNVREYSQCALNTFGSMALLK